MQCYGESSEYDLVLYLAWHIPTKELKTLIQNCFDGRKYICMFIFVFYISRKHSIFSHAFWKLA